MLEASQHEHSSFVTLTYRDDGQSSVDPEHTVRWLKRLRKRVEPFKIRYFLVGEYGDKSFRPHYHAALFGYPSCGGGPLLSGGCGCQWCLGVRETWHFGHVLLGPLSTASANYIAGYVTKKLILKDDARLVGRHPEFARMSLWPGIGASAMEAVALAMMRSKLDQSMEDVPTGLRHGREVLRLGRYLRRKLREKIGRDPSCPVPFGEEELRLVRSYAFCVDKSVSAVFSELAGSSPPYIPKGSL